VSDAAWPWLALAGLGAYHGINPAMGWLFAVALGLQEGRRGAVLKALPAIALGHEASIGLVVAVVSLAQVAGAGDALRWTGALALIGFGCFKLLKPRAHPRWVGLRVTSVDLVVWSFLMSTAHGAGLMLFPILVAHAHDLPEADFAATTVFDAVLAVLVHTGAMLAAMTAVALLVYEKLGVDVLRKAWLNLDVVWSVAIIGAGALTLFT
jgi:hypothetical protein